VFSAAELTRLRAMQTDFLPDTCSIQTYTAASDSQGGRTDTWTTTQTGVPCRVWPSDLSPSERVTLERLATERVYAVTVPVTITVTERDRIVWSGHTLEVKSVALQTHELARRLVAEEVA